MTTDSAVFDELSTRLSDRLIAQGDAEYEQARALWNGSIDVRPAAIARCASVEEVSAAMSFAAANGYTVAVRAGGHSLAGLSTLEHGLVIDLSPMKRIRVDVDSRRAFAQAGALGGDLDRATQAHGLGTTLGTVSHTGIAGLTLGGGMGWAMRRHGYACDNVRSIEAVLADGSIVRVSDDEHSDLFWALRGGGGGFAVATEFEYELHAFGPKIVLGQLAFSSDSGAEAMRLARDLARGWSRDRNIFLAYLPLPDDPDLPEPARGSFVFMVMATSFDLADAESGWLDPLVELGPVFADIGECDYVWLQTMFDEDNRHGVRAYGKGSFIDALTDEAVSVFSERVSHARGEALIYLQQLGGAVGDLAGTNSAAQGRLGEYVLNVIARGTDPAGDEARRLFALSVVDAMQPFALPSTPLNFDGDEQSASLPYAPHDPIAKRLLEIKAKYDPTDLLGELRR